MRARRTVSIILGAAVMYAGVSAVSAAAVKHHAPKSAPIKSPAAKPKSTVGAWIHNLAARGGTARTRTSRYAAGQEAAKLGATVGHECTGRASMPRNDRQWVVLCSNGKTYVVAAPGSHEVATPAVACSLAGTGPEPACFQ